MQQSNMMTSMNITATVFVIEISKGRNSAPDLVISTILPALSPLLAIAKLNGPRRYPLASATSENCELQNTWKPVELFTIIGKCITKGFSPILVMCQS